MSRLTVEQRKNVPAKQQKKIIQKLLNDKEVTTKLSTSEVCLLQEVIKDFQIRCMNNEPGFEMYCKE